MKLYFSQAFTGFKAILSQLKNTEFAIAKKRNRTLDWSKKWKYLEI